MKNKKKKKRTVRPGLTRVSSSFYAAAVGAKPGEDIWPKAQRARGRGGASIQETTVKRWERDGLVKVSTRGPKSGEHRLTRPIAAAVLTKQGADRLRARLQRRQK